MGVDIQSDDGTILLCKATRQYLLTLRLSGYCLVALQTKPKGSICLLYIMQISQPPNNRPHIYRCRPRTLPLGHGGSPQY